MRRIAPSAIVRVTVAALSVAALVIATAGCGGGKSGDPGSKDAAGAGSPGGEDLHLRRLQRLPHAGGRGSDREGRPEPRRAEAEPADRREPGPKRRQRDALVRGQAERGGDQAGRGVRLHGGRHRAKAGKISFEPNDKKVDDCKDTGLLRAGVRQPRLRRGARRWRSTSSSTLSSTNRAVAADCHPIAHKIGAGGLLHYKGDVGKAFADGNGTCGSGYYHGLLQWKLAGRQGRPGGRGREHRLQGPDHRGERVQLLPVRPRPRARPDALHLLRPPAGARLLPPAADRGVDSIMCSGGVFMENQSSSFGLKSKWLSKKNLLYPCNSKLVQRQRQALLLPADHVAHPPVRPRRLGEDGGLVPQERPRLGAVLLPVHGP